MKRQMFEELLGSVREAGEILRGRQKPSGRGVFRSLRAVDRGGREDGAEPGTGPAAAPLRINGHDPASVKAIRRI